MTTKRLTKAGKELLMSARSATELAPFDFDSKADAYRELAGLDYLRTAQTEHAPGRYKGILSEAGQTRAASFDPKPETAKRATVDPSQFAVRTPAQAPMPEFARRGGTGQAPLYPFEQVGAGPLGGSFFVPVSESKPEPWKTFNSTVSSFNGKARKQFDDAKPENRKPAPVFRLSTTPEEFNGVKGAGVYLVGYYEGAATAEAGAEGAAAESA